MSIAVIFEIRYSYTLVLQYGINLATEHLNS